MDLFDILRDEFKKTGKGPFDGYMRDCTDAEREKYCNPLHAGFSMSLSDIAIRIGQHKKALQNLEAMYAFGKSMSPGYNASEFETMIRERFPDRPNLVYAILESCTRAVAETDSFEQLCEAVGNQAAVELRDSLT